MCSFIFIHSSNMFIPSSKSLAIAISLFSAAVRSLWRSFNLYVATLTTPQQWCHCMLTHPPVHLSIAAGRWGGKARGISRTKFGGRGVTVHNIHGYSSFSIQQKRNTRETSLIFTFIKTNIIMLNVFDPVFLGCVLSSKSRSFFIKKCVVL